MTLSFDSIRSYAENAGELNSDSLPAAIVRLTSAIERLERVELDLEKSLELVLRPSYPTTVGIDGIDGNAKCAQSSPSPIRTGIDASVRAINEIVDRIVTLVDRSDI